MQMNELVTTLSPTLSTVTSSALTAWAAAAREGGLAVNTLRAYGTDSRAFADWCRVQGLTSLPANADTVVRFLKAESATGKAVATVRRRAASIGRMHKAANLANPCQHELVRMALKGVARNRGTGQRQAVALNERDTVTIRARLGDSTRNLRDVALMLCGRDLLARASEMVTLTVADFEGTEDGALVRLRRHKTSTNTLTYFVGVEAAAGVKAWLAKAGITQGPLFQTLYKGGAATGRPLDTRDVRRILKGLAVTAGLKHGSDVSGHSLRVGMAQDLVAANMDLASVMQAGGWATPLMVSRYTEKLTARRGAVARYYGSR